METFSHCSNCSLKFHNRKKCPICKIPVVYDEKRLKQPLRVCSNDSMDFGDCSNYDLVTEIEFQETRRRK